MLLIRVFIRKVALPCRFSTPWLFFSSFVVINIGLNLHLHSLLRKAFGKKNNRELLSYQLLDMLIFQEHRIVRIVQRVKRIQWIIIFGTKASWIGNHNSNASNLISHIMKISRTLRKAVWPFWNAQARHGWNLRRRCSITIVGIPIFPV